MIAAVAGLDTSSCKSLQYRGKACTYFHHTLPSYTLTDHERSRTPPPA